MLNGFGALIKRCSRRWTSEFCDDNGPRPRRESLGWGGVTAVSGATGLSRVTITAGLAELDLPVEERLVESRRVRRPGGGRPLSTDSDPQLLATLESLIEPMTRGDPESALRWTCKSTRRLADELMRRGHSVGRGTVATLLHTAGYSLQANRKTREKPPWHPDRDAQFIALTAWCAKPPASRPAGRVGRHEKEGIGRGFQERRARVAPAGPARAGPST